MSIDTDMTDLAIPGRKLIYIFDCFVGKEAAISKEVSAVSIKKTKRSWFWCCCNEWCNGPEKIKIVTTRRHRRCPTCGWRAMPYDKAAYREIEESPND